MANASRAQPKEELPDAPPEPSTADAGIDWMIWLEDVDFCPLMDCDAVPRAPFRVAGARVVGALGRDIVRHYIRQQTPRYRSCYETGLRRNPDLEGRVELLVLVRSETGQVVHGAVRESTLGDPGVEACLVETVRGIRFPRPEGGGLVMVSYPLAFRARPRLARR